EIFNLVQVQALAGPLKDIQRLVLKPLLFFIIFFFSHENLLLLQETSAVREALREHQKAGGGTIRENTTQEGAGYYVDATHSEDIRKMTVKKVVYGIGCSWPIMDSEKKLLQATAHAHIELGCPVIIHLVWNPGAADDISKAVMSHLDRTIFDNGELLEFAKMRNNLEYNLFGTEMLNYAYNLEVDMPSDSQRVRLVAFLVQEGYEDNIVIVHDIHTKNRLTKYGGQDYSHILKNIVAKMLSRVINQTQVDKTLIENSKRWLTFK
uniref:N-acetyltaurine hydrolase n=1 Tax=Hucho hucho TaxID=62062 RepID=A0A4W5N3C3_9TELE